MNNTQNADNTKSVDNALFSAVADLEGHIINLSGMTHALWSITEAYDEEHRGAIWISGKLNGIVAKLKEDWEVAFKLAVQAKKGGQS